MLFRYLRILNAFGEIRGYYENNSGSKNLEDRHLKKLYRFLDYDLSLLSMQDPVQEEMRHRGWDCEPLFYQINRLRSEIIDFIRKYDSGIDVIDDSGEDKSI